MMLSVGLIIAMMGMVWSSLDSSVSSVKDSVETLERLTNQRLSAMEHVIYTPVDRDDNPIRHTEAIHTLQTEAVRNNLRSEERRQEMLASLRDHERSSGHPFVVTKISATEEKLIEVETQFRHLDRFIQLLWQQTYGEPLPNPPNKG